MKISLILTVFNGQDSIKDCLKSILMLKYPKENIELIIVDDCSTDNTRQIIKKFSNNFSKKGIKYSVFLLNKNVGRIKARIKGVRNASYNRVMIIDVQMRIKADAIKRLSSYSNNSHLITNLTMEKYKTIDSTVLYLLRKKYYYPYWGNSFANIKLTEKNFKKISKGTGGFITDKNTFLKISGLLKGDKIENEDTKLFKLYLVHGIQLKRVSDIRSEYVNRSGFKSIKHLFMRGPRFVDYYFSNNFFLTLKYLLFVFLFISISLLALINLKTALFIVIIIFFLHLLLSMYLSENFKDFLIVFMYLPLLSLTFFLGIAYGIFLHLGKNI